MFMQYALTSIAIALGALAHLRAFSFEKQCLSGDETLVGTALLLLRYSPGLKEIALRRMHSKYRNGIKEQGTFLVLDSVEGRYLDVCERGLESDDSEFDRRYRHDMRSAGT
jgi:hypothetical protein